MSSLLDSESFCSTAEVQKRVKQILELAQPSPDLEEKIFLVLEQPGQILSTNGGRKTKLVTTVYSSFGGYPNERLSNLAAALELLIPAFDVIDDVQDGKLWEGVERVELGSWLNVALYLLHLGQQVLSSCEFEPRYLVKAQTNLNARVLEAVNGQNCDLLSEGCQLDSQAALKISATKSGALMQAAFETAAILAEVSDGVVEIAGRIGQLLGVCRQLINDLEDLCPGKLAEFSDAEKIAAIRDSDIGRRKKTVPVTFALNFARQYPSEKNAFLREYYEKAKAEPLKLEEFGLLCETIRDSGAFAYVQILREMHSKEAQRLIAQLEGIGYSEASKLAELFKI